MTKRNTSTGSKGFVHSFHLSIQLAVFIITSKKAQTVVLYLDHVNGNVSTYTKMSLSEIFTVNPIIEFKEFSFQYNSQTEPTLHDINLKVFRGEKILITGPSGCGKSTLAHIINGLIPCSYPGKCMGEIHVAGLEPAKEGVFGMSKHVGTVLQDTNGQFIGLTVAEDLAFALENDAVSQNEMFRKVDEIADIIDMKAFLKHSPSALSGGQKQRVSMGGVLVDNVEILLFDEPLANLDPATGKRTINLIDTIMKNKDLTVIIIEHRLEDVLFRDVDRIVVVNDGTIIADEKPDQLLSGNVLIDHGIREPLYLAAIRQAGMKVNPDDKPQHIETMNIEPYREGILRWFHNMKPKEVFPKKEPVLTVKNLSFSYVKEELVLQDINLEITSGEMISIVGRNGAGKSTFASLLCGFIKPDSGEILLNGKDISPLSIKERGEKIGFVMQSPNQMISKPMIREEVSLGLKVRNVPKDEIAKKVDETLRICGLYPFRNWPVNALSFGQKKRVTIASILVMKPDILILDEPTAGQDYRNYTDIMEFLKKLNKELGLTILMITHDMHLMLEYTDRAVVLTDHKILKDDTPANILTNEEIADRAYLKKTSLYDLAVKCGINEASEFAERFIESERLSRGENV